MDYRPLGRTGVKVSSLCLGCMMFGGKTQPDDSYAIIDKAIDEGINFIDTANVYSIGRSEEVTGEALKRNGRAQPRRAGDEGTRRDEQRGPEHAGELAAAHHPAVRGVAEAAADGLDRPVPDPPAAIGHPDRRDAAGAGRSDPGGEGAVRGEQHVRCVATGRELLRGEGTGTNRFICEQPPYNLLDRRIERELLPMAQTYGLAIIPWSPLAGGLLTGKYKRG